MSAPPEEIQKQLESFKRDNNSVRQQIIDICDNMSSGPTWNEAYQLSPAERNRIIKHINKKIQKKSGKEWM